MKTKNRAAALSHGMIDTLEAIVAHDRRGHSADPDLYPTRSVLALIRRGLIERMSDGYVRPTLKGVRVVCALEGTAL